MFTSKKDIDRHVKTSLNKLPENERYLRGLAIARQYFKLNEYGSAEHWLSCYLSVQEDSAPAYKLLGQCYEKQRRYDRAITQYQRSLQLDSKQTGLITDVCRLLLMEDNLSKNLSKAKYWCDLAETERINHEAVLNLKLKVANKDANSDQLLVKDIIVREILARPHDPALRVRLVEYFLDEKQLEEAFRYCFELEMKFSETFLQSIEWTNVMARMLSKYAGDASAQKQYSWHYYLLQAIVLDRQIYLSLLSDSTMETIKRSNIKEIASKLYELDQLLRLVAEKGKNAAPHKQLADEYLRHYRGQLLLHSASLMFKGTADPQQGSTRTTRGRETTKRCLALLLLAYQCGVPKTEAAWLKQSNESSRQVMTFWSKQAAFRCCQAGSTVLSCVDNNSLDVSVLAEIQSVTESKVWTTADNLLDQVRQLCADPGWRKDVFRALYPSGDSSAKAATSYFVQEQHTLGAPQYVLPKREQLEAYLELAQSLFPSSLPYLVYLGLAMGTDNLADLRCRAFPRLNFSTNNLDSCNLETLNQLDMDSFLYCSILVAHSNLLEGERQHYRAAAAGAEGRPAFLPAPNLLPLLCEENKVEWWSTAYHLIRSSTAKEAATSVAEQKQLLQHGLQAIRGTGAPLCDVMVLLKLGQILAKRASSGSAPPEERRQTEFRAETVYRAAVLLWKHRNDSGAAPSSSGSMFFRYGIESYDCQQETVKLTEAGITFLAGVYFKHGRHLEFTQDFAGIPLPYAAFFRAEAFKKLDESNKTPMKGSGKKLHSERARECIRLTQQYLTLPYIERNHPLNYVVQGELKRMSFSGNDSFDATLNASANGGVLDESDHFQSFTSTAAGSVGGMRTERDTAAAVATAAANVCLSKTNELESLIRQVMETLTFVKEDVLSIRNDVGDMQDRLVKIEENIYRKPLEDKPKESSSSNGPARSTATDGDQQQQQQQNQQATVNAAAAAAALQVMNEMYLMDEFQNSAVAANAAYHQQVHASGGRAPAGIGLPPQPVLSYGALYGAGAGAYANYLSPAVQQTQQQQQQQQLLTPRGHTGLAGPAAALGVSPLHTYQHPDPNQQQMLLAAMNSPVAVPGVSTGYHPLPPTYHQQALPVAAPPTTVVPQPAPATAKGTLSLEQSLQTPSVVNSWNKTYNVAAAFNSMPPVAAAPPPQPPTAAVHHVSADKGAAPVNVVITSSDPLPPRAGAAHNSTSFAAGASTVAATQPTYSVTIPPQHIKHSATGGSIGQGTTAAATPKLDTISPVAGTGQTSFLQQSAAPATSINSMKPAALTSNTTVGSTVSTSSPSFFSSAINSPTVKALLTGSGGAGNDGDDGDDDEDDAKNLSGTAEYDPRPDFQPIIPLPDEIVVRTGEEDEEQMFSGRSKLLRLVDREWKERGLGELKILRSKADASKYRIVMRREQIHKICANHYITPELIIKPMDKRPECYIWAAMDFADEEPRKESFCARFGTADLAKQFYEAFVAARDAVSKLRANDPVSSSTSSVPAQPPPTTIPPSFSFGASKPPAPSVPAATAPAATTKAPFGEFTFTKNYTLPKVAASTESSTAQTNQSASKPSPFASFTFKGQTAPANTSSAGIEQAGGGVFGGGPGLGFDEKDYQCIHVTPIVGLKCKEQPQAKDWSDYGNVPASGATLRLLSGTVNGAPIVRLLIRKPGLLVAATVCLSQILDKDTRVAVVEKNGASWTGAQDGAMPTATTAKGQAYAAYFKTTDERDKFLAEIKKVLPGAVAVSSATPAGPKPAATVGFGDLFKPKSGSWDCAECYVNNKADATHCLACNGPRDPSVKAADATKPKGGLFDNLAATGGSSGSKFTFGMPPTTGTAQSTITFGVAPAEPAKIAAPAAAKPAAATPAAGGFGDKFKPKPGAWTCNACYLSNGADTLYCMSCESPKDDTVPKKSSAADPIGGLLKAADTMPKFNFTAGGGFSFGVPPPASTASTAATVAASTTTTTSAVASSQPAAAPVFGGGFTFGSPMKPPATTGEATATTIGTPAKPVFKFELPTPTTGGLSFGSKLAPTQHQSQQGDGAPEKTSFGFVFKPKSPGRTQSTSSGGGAGDGGDDDAGGADSSVTEEENNTYFAPVIPLPDKVEVKTGEEDEHVLYAHRAKLYRFISSEWKERGIGDVKILKHKETGKLRVVMRREQVLKICLNHALTEEVCYSKKDDKSWQFVANDFSEGSFELMNFCLRFKSADVAQEFRDAITDALSGKLNPPPASTVTSTATPTAATQSDSRDSTITSTTSPLGEFNFSKLSDVSLNEREMLEKCKLPADFFDAPATGPCPGCPGCDPDAFVFPTYDRKSLADPGSDGGSLPLDIGEVPTLPERRAVAAVPKKVSFGDAKEPLSTAAKPPVFGGLTFGVPSSTGTSTISTATNSFIAAEQKSASASPSPFVASSGSIFGGDKTSTPVGGGLIFGSSQAGGIGSGASGGSIFSASLNTTPKTTFVSPPSTATESVSAVATGTTTTTASVIKPSAIATPLLQQPSLTATTTPKPIEGGNLFGGSPFGSGGSTKSIFGSGSVTTTPVANATATPPSNLFGSVSFGGANSPNFSFGGIGKLGGSAATTTPAQPSPGLGLFGGVATGKPFGTIAAPDAPPVLKMDGGVSFADLANSSPGFGDFKKQDGGGGDVATPGSQQKGTTAPPAGFVGLTVKEDFFSRSAANKLNSSGGDGTAANNNGKADDDEGVGGDEHYDPYYAPVIQLPDEIEVRTGEEEETKVFGDRAKLFRYDSDTKEWKERGVGELKILHHPVRNTYRMLLRREQIFKLVLNHAITTDLAVTPMNNSGKAFVWAAMNHAEGPAALEKLAVRFKNETIGGEFLKALENCQEKLRTRPDLEPDQD